MPSLLALLYYFFTRDNTVFIVSMTQNMTVYIAKKLCSFTPQLSLNFKSKMGSELAALVPSIHQKLDELRSCLLEPF